MQSIENKAKYITWDVFCKLVHDRFGRDQHEILVRQLFHIKQTGSVADYVEEFAELVDQLSAYTSTTDPLYYTLTFIDGLRDDIKSIVLVQRPADLDTACVLASLQEEVGDSYKRRDNMRLESGFHPRTLTKSLLPLPAPPPHVKQVAPQPSDDRRSAESARASSPLEAKAAALCTYRHAMGLCYKCNEKWTKDHMCSSTVQLHADQEIWELFQVEDDENTSPNSINTNGPNEQLLMESSKTALTGSQAPRTVKFKGYIQDKVVSVLVDSGSSSSFITHLLQHI
jgi:hypothetical protein